MKSGFSKKIIFISFLSILLSPLPSLAAKEGCSVVMASYCGKDVLTGKSTDYSPSMDYTDCGLSGDPDPSQVCCCPGKYQINEGGQVYREGEGATKVPKFTIKSQNLQCRNGKSLLILSS